MQATLDTPVTNAELDSFWGIEVTAFEWADARQRQAAAYDKDDLIETAWEFDKEILSALEAGNFQAVGEIFATQRAVTIAKRVAAELGVAA